MSEGTTELETGVGTVENVAYKLMNRVLGTKPVKPGGNTAKAIIEWYAVCLKVVRGEDPSKLKLPNE